MITPVRPVGSAGSVPPAVDPVAIENVVLAVDGSARAERAVPVVRRLARSLGARLTVVGVAEPRQDRVPLQQAVQQAAARLGGDAVVAVSDDVPGAILYEALQLPRHVLCIPSHGRGRSAGVLGSVTAQVVASAVEPVLVLGPEVSAGHRFEGRLVACVDGSELSEGVLPAAVAWASALELDLAVTTVAEPIPDPVVPGAPYRRSHGPHEVAEDYVSRLAQRWMAEGHTVSGEVVDDPTSVVNGLTHHLARHPAAMVALTTHARTGLARLVLGSVAAGIVHGASAPVLVIPGGL